MASKGDAGVLSSHMKMNRPRALRAAQALPRPEKVEKPDRGGVRCAGSLLIARTGLGRPLKIFGTPHRCVVRSCCAGEFLKLRLPEIPQRPVPDLPALPHDLRNVVLEQEAIFHQLAGGRFDLADIFRPILILLPDPLFRKWQVGPGVGQQSSRGPQYS